MRNLMAVEARREEEEVLLIPVVVHVLFRTPQDNVSLAQIESQIDALNADFGGATISKVPVWFQDRAADVGLRFVLEAVTRTQTSRRVWGFNHDMKNPEEGGKAPVDPERKLNIWVCRIGDWAGQSVLGYGSFPVFENQNIDGVVIDPTAFGTTGTAKAPLNKGRTATHEVGHYLNLFHVWGKGSCSSTDHVEDTPTQNSYYEGCPSSESMSACSPDQHAMNQNFMDYVEDACMTLVILMTLLTLLTLPALLTLLTLLTLLALLSLLTLPNLLTLLTCRSLLRAKSSGCAAYSRWVVHFSTIHALPLPSP
jgi:hypothetical protein